MSKLLRIYGEKVAIGGGHQPTNELHVVGTRPARFERTGVATLEFSMDNNYGASNTTCTLTFEHKVANGGFLFKSTNSSNTMISAMVITSDGNVGI